MEIDYQILMELTGAFIAIGSCIKLAQGISKNWRKTKEEHKAAVLFEAKEHVSKARAELQAEIDIVKNELKNLEHNVEKDLIHLKETYNGEIKNLGEKIEQLRSELRNQHGQLVTLLTKMIEKD